MSTVTNSRIWIFPKSEYLVKELLGWGLFLNNSKSVLILAPVLLAAVLLWPLWSVVLPAMSDYPAHVSALYVQMHGAHDPSLSRFYQTEWDFVPDLASEILVPLIAIVIPFLVSVKLFLSLALVMWVAAPIAIHYALYKRVGVAALAGRIVCLQCGLHVGLHQFLFCGRAVAHHLCGLDRHRKICGASAHRRVCACHVGVVLLSCARRDVAGVVAAVLRNAAGRR